MENDLVMPPAWLPTSDDGYNQLKGRAVESSDGEAIGEVKAIFHPPEPHRPGEKTHYLLLDHAQLTGPDGGEDLYMSETAIERVEPDRIVVRWTRDELEHQGWRGRPDLISDFRES
jgi:hypothetical protein